MSLAFSLCNGVLPWGQERLGLSVGLKGNGMCFSRRGLTRFPWKAYGLVEDAEFSLMLRLAGERVHFLPEARVFGEMVSGGGPAAASQRSRWEAGRRALARQVPGPAAPIVPTGDRTQVGVCHRAAHAPAGDTPDGPLSRASLRLLARFVPTLGTAAALALAGPRIDGARAGRLRALPGAGDGAPAPLFLGPAGPSLLPRLEAGRRDPGRPLGLGPTAREPRQQRDLQRRPTRSSISARPCGPPGRPPARSSGGAARPASARRASSSGSTGASRRPGA